MTNSSNIAKISVQKHESKEQFLYDLDKTKSLCELVKDICKTVGLPISPVYGLKLIQIKNDPANPMIDSYVSEKNVKNIQHNDCLKIVFSIEYLLRDRIIPHINETEGTPERDICYEALTKLCFDPVFIEELVESGNHHTLITTFLDDDNLKENELKALLATICHLFQKGFITDTSHRFVQKSIKIIKKDVDNQSPEHVIYALAILHKILIQKDATFLKWKEQIIKEVPITCITPYFRNGSSIGKQLQYGVLLLINTIIRLCKGDQRKQLIKEMNLAKNREDIYKYIIDPGGQLDKNMEHELYVIQTYLLSLYDEALKSEVSLNDNSVFKREEFELEEEDVKRVTVLMDFDEVDLSMKSPTVETMLAYSQPERWSLASLMSDRSQGSRKSSIAYSSRSRNTSIYLDYEMSSISYLTLEALRHFKTTHKKNFYQSQIEEKVYEPGLFATSERVVKMLAQMLHIGLDPPDSRSVFYQPIVFNTSPRQPFFLELFSRTMWLLSKTRREMKVSTMEDYPKVMNVLQKQIKMVLTMRPMNIKKLTDEIKEINFAAVSEQWQKEKEEELKNILKNNQSIKELREKYSAENEQHVLEHRKNVIKNGDYFPNVHEKKINGTMFVELCKNEKELLLYDIIDEKTKSKVLREKVKLGEITHVAIGLNCKHSHLLAEDNAGLMPPPQTAIRQKVDTRIKNFKNCAELALEGIRQRESLVERNYTDDITPTAENNMSEDMHDQGENSSASIYNVCCSHSTMIEKIFENGIAIKTILQEQQKSIKNLLGSEADKSTKNIENFKSVPTKPFKKFESLLKYENNMNESEEARRQLETLFYICGGSCAKDSVRRGLAKIFSDRLARHCSLTGRKGNHPVKSLTIIRLLKVGWPQIKEFSLVCLIFQKLYSIIKDIWCKSPLLAFSILINYTENQWNFIAKDERMACYWTDAFHILTGNVKRSVYFKSELEELVEMDLRLKIIELQNISIPKNAPPLPPVPKPPVPPKSPALAEHMKTRTKKINSR